MECNIDAKGKAVRLILGLLNVAAAVALAVMLSTGALTAGWWWAVAAGAAAGGGVAVFEGWKGWCVVRALGFKTPI